MSCRVKVQKGFQEQFSPLTHVQERVYSVLLDAWQFILLLYRQLTLQ